MSPDRGEGAWEEVGASSVTLTFPSTGNAARKDANRRFWGQRDAMLRRPARAVQIYRIARVFLSIQKVEGKKSIKFDCQ